MPTALAPQWRIWRERRIPVPGMHADAAAAGRSSSATLSAITAYLQLEAEVGAYVAQDVEQPKLAQVRSDIASLLALPANGVAFLESASASLRALLTAWPIPSAGRVGVAPSEWGPNLAAFDAVGMRPVLLATDDAGVIDLDRLKRLLATDPPTFVHVTQVAAHRALVQPARHIAAVCREAGVPLWVDAAQALGHVDTAVGADVMYATGRKWLCGPRGVGLLAVHERWWSSLQVRRRPLATSDEPTLRALESDDAYVAGRIGLGTAVRELLDDGPPKVWSRLADVGARTRAALADLTTWAVQPANGSAITTIEPRAGQDVVKVRRRLLEEHSILTTASLPARAPMDVTRPTLRISPHVDSTDAQLDALYTALVANS